MNERGYLVDRATQAWVRVTGRRVDLSLDSWLAGPVGSPAGIGDEWLDREAARLGATRRSGGGLLASVEALASEAFDPGELRPEIVEFYERTSHFRLEVWSQWCPMMWPGGWLISTLFARRLQQLALPLRPLDAAKGIDSEVIALDRAGVQLGAAWLRTLRSSGQTIYSGWYGIAQLPRSDHPSIRVMFPLPNGSVAVFLEPSVAPGGALVLRSPIARFGDNGAYLVVVDGDEADVRRVPINETFRVYVDEEGVLRTDHELRLWRMPVIRFHYRIERTPSEPSS